jgi:predicted acylesterase/phospholipase RssA
MRYLILGPGGQGFFAMLGCLKKVEDQLKDVEEISGSSAGSMLGFLLTSGKSVSEIFDLSTKLDVGELTKMNLKSFINSFGFIEHEPVKKKLIELWGGNPTFKELNKKLYVSAFCMNTKEVEYFSRDTHPNMNVVDAICMSISVPFMFAGYRYNDKIYIDGGTNETIPALPFLNKNKGDVFCISISCNYKNPINIKTFLDYLKCIIEYSHNIRNDYVLPGIFMDLSSYDLLNMKMPLEEKLKLFIFGLSAKQSVF